MEPVDPLNRVLRDSLALDPASQTKLACLLLSQNLKRHDPNHIQIATGMMYMIPALGAAADAMRNKVCATCGAPDHNVKIADVAADADTAKCQP